MSKESHGKCLNIKHWTQEKNDELFEISKELLGKWADENYTDISDKEFTYSKKYVETDMGTKEYDESLHDEKDVYCFICIIFKGIKKEIEEQ